ATSRLGPGCDTLAYIWPRSWRKPETLIWPIRPGCVFDPKGDSRQPCVRSEPEALPGPPGDHLLLDLMTKGSVFSDRRTSQWHGRDDFKAASRPLADGQARDLPRRRRSGVERRLHGAYVTVDDTGARHAGESGYTTQIGSDRFTVFRTGPSKSRQAFLS